MRPSATYRVQLHEEFTFDDARAIVAYLSDLGISHLYASPFLKAAPHSRHGYDIVDHTRLNPEIGTREQFTQLVTGLREHGMGLVADFVPNHMGIGSNENRWWQDVLEWGESSPFATFFDIDWEPLRPQLRGKVLLPFLGDQYGTVLRNGEIKLAYDDEGGIFSVAYYENRYPLKPASYATVLRTTGEPALAELAEAFAPLDQRPEAPEERTVMRARADAARQRLREAMRDPANRHALERTIDRFNGDPGNEASFEELHALLSEQHYRVSNWKVAAEEINYRRFFDINGLAALLMENPETFAVAHRLIFDLIGEGSVQGLRIDHVDGLFDPQAYCSLLRQRAEMLDQELYLVVEKILAQGERLRENWRVDGTTGYEFATDVCGLFVQSANAGAFTRLYTRFSGNTQLFGDTVYEAKRHIMDTSLASELNVLARSLDRVAQMDPSSSDFTLYGLRSALKEIVACFPVYRTYVTSESLDAADREYIAAAVAGARKRNPFADKSIYDFTESVLDTSILDRPSARYDRRAVLHFAMRIQQYTSPVMAKGVEDTAFYRYNRLAALNEVGGTPEQFGVSVAHFHRTNRTRSASWPGAMTTTATHDTKRGEDARTRIAVLSEMPGRWSRSIARWRRTNDAVRAGTVPGGNVEYLLYQALVGAWPAEFLGRTEFSVDELAPFAERINTYVVKAVREAKELSSWASPDAVYEHALTGFVDGMVDPSRSKAFLADFADFMSYLAPLGAWNSLAQTVLKLGGPGVPDTYQGTELWDFSLVDPDNRRPVDYAARAAMLAELQTASDPEALVGNLLANWTDGRIKLYIAWKLLCQRRERPAAEAGYTPIFSAGPRASHVVAYANDGMIVAVPRLIATLLEERDSPPIGEETWGTTSLRVPEKMRGTYRNIFTGGVHTIDSLAGRMARLSLAEVLARFPVAVLVQT